MSLKITGTCSRTTEKGRKTIGTCVAPWTTHAVPTSDGRGQNRNNRIFIEYRKKEPRNRECSSYYSSIMINNRLGIGVRDHLRFIVPIKRRITTKRQSGRPFYTRTVHGTSPVFALSRLRIAFILSAVDFSFSAFSSLPSFVYVSRV